VESKRKQRADMVRQLMKKDILESAFLLTLEKGIPGVTIVDIAQKAGTSRVNIYNYYKSIDEIMFDVQTDVLTQLHAFSDFEAPKEQNGAQQLAALLYQLIGRFKTHRDQIRFTAVFDHAYRTAYPLPELQEMYREFIRNLYGPIESVLLQGIEDGSLDLADHLKADIRVLTMTLIHSTFGTMQRLATRRNVFQQDSAQADFAILENFLSLLLKSLTA
jgi:AcrR family transcriptional regulator